MAYGAPPFVGDGLIFPRLTAKEDRFLQFWTDQRNFTTQASRISGSSASADFYRNTDLRHAGSKRKKYLPFCFLILLLCACVRGFSEFAFHGRAASVISLEFPPLVRKKKEGKMNKGKMERGKVSFKSFQMSFVFLP